MGGADNICSDKTGTLTMNKMTVTRMFLCEDTIEKPSDSNITGGKLKEMISVGVCLNSSANPIFTGSTVEQIGNKTDCALLELAHNLGYNYREVRNQYSGDIIKVVPFASKTKSMSTIITVKGRSVVYTKGAPELVIKNCSKFLNI